MMEQNPYSTGTEKEHKYWLF